MARHNQAPSVVDYARFHGLASNYLADGPLEPDSLPRAPPFLNQELADPPNAAKIEWPEEFQLNERLELDMLGAKALAFACRAPPLPAVTEPSVEVGLHRVRNIKVELPVLRSDNELDMVKFMRRKEKALSKFKFPLEELNDEEDEGLTWPKKCWERLEQIHKQLESEKLQMTRTDFLYFQSCLKDEFTDADQDLMVNQVLKEAEDKIIRIPFAEPVTPPILPMDPPLNPFPDPRSSSPTNQLEYPSSDSNSAAAEAQALEDQLMEQDTLIPPEGAQFDPVLYDEPDPELLDIFSTLTDEAPRKKRRAEDLKVEVPLTPLSSHPSSTEKNQKTVAFAEDLTQYISVTPTRQSEKDEDLPSDFLHPDDKMEDDQDYDAFFRDEVAPIADRVALRTEQEQLSEVDTLRRVEVPLMNFSLPGPPWEMYGGTNLDAQRQLLKECAREKLNLVSRDQITSLDAKLKWNPFVSERARTVVNEELRYDKELSAFMRDMTLGKVVQPEDLAWKPDGLRILDNLYEEEEDLQPVSVEPGDDIESIVRKRKIEMLESGPPPMGEPLTKQHLPSQPQSRPKALEADIKELVKKAGAPAPTPAPAQTAFGSMFGSIFSASTSLSAFMKVHSGIVVPPPAQHKSRLAEPAPPQQEPFRQSFPTAESKQEPLISLPEILNPASFVLSTHLSTHQRSLVTKIQSLYPKATLIERSPLPPLPPLFPDQPPMQTKHPEPLPAMLLAPSTALLLPTFTALAQRPLPGSKPTPNNFFPLQLARVAQRCERVFVGVWRGSHSPSSNGADATASLSEGEALALAELSGRATQLDSDVEVAFVPGGSGDGEEALARWIVRLMARFGEQPTGQEREGRRNDAASAAGLQLLQDETLWEQLLRRAGMDAFAAQVVLDALKKQKDEEDPTSSDSGEKKSQGPKNAGLAAFLLMDHEERVKRFGGAMGGRRVLDRMGQVLDQGWVSAG
ncbi:hypothetical protein IWZ00DRAFT_293817 [Phyllosticta capitalensis]